MELVLKLERTTGLPLYKQVSEAIRDAIENGRLKPGQSLPSTRDLAQSLKVARLTIRRSYEDLISQGYAQSVTGSGTFVVERIPTQENDERVKDRLRKGNAHKIKPTLSQYAGRIERTQLEIPFDQELYPELNYGIPERKDLPLKVWKQSAIKHLQFRDPHMPMYSGDPMGLARLREVLASYLKRVRSVNCEPDQIAIFSGTQPALDLICRLTLEPGDAVAVENPGYPGTRRTFTTHGARIHPIAVDNEGLIVRKLKQSQVNFKAICVTPSHQDPTGVVMSVERRQELLEWAQQTSTFIIEDDHDSEFRYGNAPVTALQGLDTGDCVIYMSTFWKTLGPLVAMGFIVVPASLLKTFRVAKAMVERDFPLLDQCVLADFIEAGHFDRHIRRTRALYRSRRQALVHALTVNLKSLISLSSETSGMHITCRFGNDFREEEILRCASDAGLALMSTGRFYMQDAVSREYLIPFAHLDEHEIRDRAVEFALSLTSCQ